MRDRLRRKVIRDGGSHKVQNHLRTAVAIHHSLELCRGSLPKGLAGLKTLKRLQVSVLNPTMKIKWGISNREFERFLVDLDRVRFRAQRPGGFIR
jgi:hypothetical protein